MTARIHSFALCLSLLALTAPAAAENFHVEARIYCPASLTLDPAGRTVADESFSDASIQFVPCSGILVEAMDADDDWDDHCGSAFTDSSGVVSFGARCSDPTGLPDLYLKVSSRGTTDFSVGTYDFTFWDTVADVLVTFGTLGLGVALQATGVAPLPNWVVSHSTAEWVTPEGVIGNGQFRNFGRMAIGDDFDAIDRIHHATDVATLPAGANTTAFHAARQFWAVNFAMERIHAGTRLVPMHFDYTVDHALFGSPSTLWDTVIVHDGEFAANPSIELDKTAHEIGHVVHNTFHSGYNHWIALDALSYAKRHEMCKSDTLILAWYEGFAHFISDYVFRAELRSASDSAGAPYQPFDTSCAGGFAIEGNVRNFLSAMYYGLEERVHPAPPSDDEFWCRNGETRVWDGNRWQCQWQHQAMCDFTAQTLRDEQGNVDYCRRCPDPLQPSPVTILGGSSWDRGDCPEGQNCLAFDSPIQVTPVLPPPSGSQGSSSITLTINPDGSVTTTGSNSGGSSGGSNPPPECSEEPISCQLVSPPGVSSSVSRVAGADMCTLFQEANHTPPTNPAGARTLRRDGTFGEMLSTTHGGSRAWFGLPSLDEMIALVMNNGSGEHRLQEHWNQGIGSFCRGSDGHGRDFFCNPDESALFLQHTNTLGSWTP